MRYFVITALMLLLASTTLAADQFGWDSSNYSPTTGNGGGEDIATAEVIAAMPFQDTGNTCGHVDDYDPGPGWSCYQVSAAPDLVYSYTPTVDEILFINLAGSNYDTKVFVYDQNLELYECDDQYWNDFNGDNTSAIPDLFVEAGRTYFIVIDGSNLSSTDNCGDFVLDIVASAPPVCDLVPGDRILENEPTIGEGYYDEHNGGCVWGFMFPINTVELTATPDGTLPVFANSALYYMPDFNMDIQDYDYFSIYLGPTGIATITVQSEYRMQFNAKQPADCDEYVNAFTILTDDACTEYTEMIFGAPGEKVWISASALFPIPGGFEGPEFDYTMDFEGLQAGGTVATEDVSWDTLKSLYR